MMLLDLFTFLGHLHPLVVHLPVGFLLLAFVFQLSSYSARFSHLQQAVSFTLLAGFIAAVLACIFGYMLSLSGDYDRVLLRHHKWAGISLAIVSGLLYLLLTQQWVVHKRSVFFVCFAAMALLTTYAGHEGGALTHGSNYLGLQTLLHQKRVKPASLNEAYLFEDVVQPLLQARCGQCHGGSKLKGKFSVESLPEILKGGKHGAVVKAGSIAESELYKRITLNRDDEKFMPSNGKTPLTKSEIEIIRWWIEKARAAEGQKLLAIKDNEAIKAKVAAYLSLTPQEAPAEENSIVQIINPAVPRFADTISVANLRRQGWKVRWMMKQPAMLDIAKPARATSSIADAQKDLERLSKNIIWLNVSDNQLTDKDLVFLGQLTNLEKLRLEKNPVTDAVCAQLQSLSHLEAVNLNETKVSMHGVELLRKNTAVKRIYNWAPQTK
jgi:uncharacterized membrane protein